MSSRHLLFRVLYRLGLTPWDGHPLANSLRALVEGDGALQGLTPGAALDVGCGTGDAAIYLAEHGWKVTGVDFVAKPITTAGAKAREAGVAVDFRQADATKLTDAGIGTGFDLIVDSGCLHGMSDDDRDRYVGELTAVAAADARLLLIEFIPGGSRGVPGIDQPEIERRFGAHWALVSAGDEPQGANRDTAALRHYLLARRK